MWSPRGRDGRIAARPAADALSSLMRDARRLHPADTSPWHYSSSSCSRSNSSPSTHPTLSACLSVCRSEQRTAASGRTSLSSENSVTRNRKHRQAAANPAAYDSGPVVYSYTLNFIRIGVLCRPCRANKSCKLTRTARRIVSHPVAKLFLIRRLEKSSRTNYAYVWRYSNFVFV